MKNSIINKLCLFVACVAAVLFAPDPCLTGCFVVLKMLSNRYYVQHLIPHAPTIIVEEQRRMVEELRTQMQDILEDTINLPQNVARQYAQDRIAQMNSEYVRILGVSQFRRIAAQEINDHRARIQTASTEFRSDLNGVLGTGDFNALTEIRERYEQRIGVARAHAILAEETARRRR